MPVRKSIIALIPLIWFASTSNILAAPDLPAAAAERARIAAYWTASRRAAAEPRDLVIDANGHGFLRGRDGHLTPYSQTVSTDGPETRGKPSGSGDTMPPSIGAMSPADGDTVGASVAFSATITDASGIKSVSFVVVYPNGQTQGFSPSRVGSSDTWTTTINGFSNGSWGWRVVAKDRASRGGNTATSATVEFTVDTDGGGNNGGNNGSDDSVGNAEWTGGGLVQASMGRIYFEMPTDRKRRRPWNGYVCSGTVIDDAAGGRSVILTAAHCVYDDANKAFARNMLFIPNQDATTGSGTDGNCSNDPIGCWVPSFGVVDDNWTRRRFPDNVAWDYGYYVVNDSGAHVGAIAPAEALDSAVASGYAGNMSQHFAAVLVDDGDPGVRSADFTHGLGYSLSDDPNFMYCADDMTVESDVNWWLPVCGLSGGSSGGAWIQPIGGGNGPIISVNSWGYTGSPGMAGPRFDNSSVDCIFVIATTESFLSVSMANGEAGVKVVCP
jgi:hypothetical protein